MTSDEALPGLVWALRATGDGRVEEFHGGRPTPPADGWLWFHFDLTDARVAAMVASLFDLPPPAGQLLTGADGHQQLHAQGPWVYGIVTDLARDLDGITDEAGKLHFAMIDRLLISGRRHRLAGVEATHRALLEGRHIGTAAGLLETIVDEVVNAVEQYTEKLSRKLDRLEETVLSPASGDERQTLGRVRRKAVRLHRQIAGLRALVRRTEHELAGGPKFAPHLAGGRLPQRLDWLDHEIVALRDRAHLLQEEVTIKIAERTNEHVRVLAIVTTVLLPPTLVSGIFGMNVKDLPLTEGTGGFYWAIGLLLGSALAVCLALKRMGLIGRR
jgi:zinc transporter